MWRQGKMNMAEAGGSQAESEPSYLAGGVSLWRGLLRRCRAVGVCAKLKEQGPGWGVVGVGASRRRVES